MSVAYTIIIHLFYFFLIPVSWFSRKTRLWIHGRKDWRQKLADWQSRDKPVYWFHSASLGEFEQGLPVMEALKNAVPESNIVISFFSPSGYEVRKNYRNADLVFYLPLDTDYNARMVIAILKPAAVFFIKYEFWYFYLNQLQKQQIPVYLLSGIFRPQQIFFKWYGYWFRKNLFAFRHLFVQNAVSAGLLNSIGINNTSVTGDTRFDRVSDNARKARDISIVQEFTGGAFCLVAGSTWAADESLLAKYINKAPGHLRFIIAPHEIDQVHISRLDRLITRDKIAYSRASQNSVKDKQVLIIDNIGMLSSIYRYGNIAYIGGGFGKGIHNVLEAAVYGIPVIFGPNHKKHSEAVGLIATGGGFSIENENDLTTLLDRLLQMDDTYLNAAVRAGNYVLNNTGSTAKIMQHLNTDLKLHWTGDWTVR